MKYKFTFVDLFAGIGGFRLALESLDGKCVFSSEIDSHACDMYKENFGDDSYCDITKLDPKSMPDFDVLCAGFPCQSFSICGKQKGFIDKTRGTLFFDIVRILKEKKPRPFILENVKNLTTHDKGRTLTVIIDTLNSLGYSVNYKVLNAKDFGVPQNRERIYIVGFHKKLVPNYSSFKFPIATHIETKVGDILEKNVNSKYTISDNLWNGHQRRKIEHKEKGNGFGYSLFNEDSPYTNTISARYYKDGSEILIEQKGKNPRKLTPREAARLQGFPENFIIPVSDTQSYKQFGNSVAVPVINAIAIEILKVLNEEKRV